MKNVYKIIRKILHEDYSFNLDQIQPETKFELELGIDSREFFELIVDFEIIFDIEINLDDATEIITIQDAVDYIQKKIIAREELYKNLF